VIATFLFPPP